MKKLKLKLGYAERLSKDEMRNIFGGEVLGDCTGYIVCKDKDGGYPVGQLSGIFNCSTVGQSDNQDVCDYFYTNSYAASCTCIY